MSRRTVHFRPQSVSAADELCGKSVIAIDRKTRAQAAAEGPLADGFVGINGYVFYENWDEIDPPGRSDDEPEIPHEEVMAKIRALLNKPIEPRR